MVEEKTLLIVEDNLADATHYQRLLEEENHDFSQVHCIRNLKEAFDYLMDHLPGCCILDYRFDNGSAKSLLEDLQKVKGEIPCPIVISTGQGDEKLAAELMRLGVQDYLVKDGLTSSELLRALNHAVKTFSLQRQLQMLALRDPLTGLLNRSIFMDRLEQAFNEGRRYRRKFALICLDLDHFKHVNDTFGHQAGDFLLRTVADKIANLVRNTDSVARLGGDEFGVLLPEADKKQADIVARKLVDTLSNSVTWQETALVISPSVGVTCFPGRAVSHEDLMREADVALYRAKNSGRAQHAAYSSELDEKHKRLNALAKALPRALLNNALQIAYQPVIHVSSGMCSHVEALLRWPFEGKWVPPLEIIDLVLDKKMGEFFHQWLFDETLAQLKKWQQLQPTLGMAINIPANLCHDRRVLNKLFSAIKEHGIKPHQVILEVTETRLMKNPDLTRQHLLELAEYGVRIAIDDFGTGYSSMEYLASLPCSMLKIDQRFFLNLEYKEKNIKIIEAISALAHGLDLTVVAEGIENESLFEVAKNYGCDYAQGYWLGKPEFSKPSLDGDDNKFSSSFLTARA